MIISRGVAIYFLTLKPKAAATANEFWSNNYITQGSECWTSPRIEGPLCSKDTFSSLYLLFFSCWLPTLGLKNSHVVVERNPRREKKIAYEEWSLSVTGLQLYPGNVTRTDRLCYSLEQAWVVTRLMSVFHYPHDQITLNGDSWLFSVEAKLDQII